MKKHIGRIANTDQRVVVVFMQIPGKDDHALVVSTDNLPERFHQATILVEVALRESWIRATPIAFVQIRGALKCACQKAATEWTVRDEPHTEPATGRQNGFSDIACPE